MSYSFTELIDSTLIAEGVFVFCYVISSLFLLSNSYAGFVGGMFGIVWIVYLAFAYYSIRMKPSRILYGVTLGVSVMLIILTLQQAIFWGQSSGCSQTADGHRRLLGIECYQIGAMKSVCTFSVFLFLAEIFLVFILLRHKDDLLPTGSDNSISPPTVPGGYAKVPQSADL